MNTNNTDSLSPINGISTLRSFFVLLVLTLCTLTLPAQAATTVSITAPANNSVYTAPGSVTLTASASTSGGYTLSKVEYFYGGTNLIGFSTTGSPWSVNWTSVPAGTYTVTAKATATKKNNSDQTATSSAITVIVNAAPTVSITSPSNNAVYPAPASITLTATAADSDGTISKVEFFRGGSTLIATVTSAPYTYNWTSVAQGSYSITAKATDNNNGTTTSSAVNIAVDTPPTVSITAPANNSTYSAPASITLTATAADSDGSISKVEFFHGGTNLIGTVTSSPYTYNWTSVPVGSYSITAKATDNQNVPTTSSPISVTVQSNAPSGMYFIHPDHLDTPRLITDGTGAVAWRWDNEDAFGNNAPNENPSSLGTFTCNLRLPGQYFDKETNLHYNYFRDYDPSIGRYVQSDPIGLRGGINTYGYVGGNPLSYIDPSGEQAALYGGACILVVTTVYFVYKYNKFVKCVEECSQCPNNPSGNPNIVCQPPPKDGNTGPIYSCRTYCGLDAFAGPRAKGAPGSRDYP